jgi:hypothetical protein
MGFKLMRWDEMATSSCDDHAICCWLPSDFNEATNCKVIGTLYNTALVWMRRDETNDMARRDNDATCCWWPLDFNEATNCRVVESWHKHGWHGGRLRLCNLLLITIGFQWRLQFAKSSRLSITSSTSVCITRRNCDGHTIFARTP